MDWGIAEGEWLVKKISKKNKSKKREKIKHGISFYTVLMKEDGKSAIE